MQYNERIPAGLQVKNYYVLGDQASYRILLLTLTDGTNKIICYTREHLTMMRECMREAIARGAVKSLEI